MLNIMHVTPTKPHHASSTQNKSLLSSAVATVVSRQQMSAYFPMHQLMQHNYIIKTCMTTYTYLTTIVQNKRSAISTFETIVSVVTTESLTNLYATDVLAELKPTKTKYMEVKTIQPTAANSLHLSTIQKIDKRIDQDDDSMYDLIQPSEVSHVSCTTTSCSCSHTKTEGLQTRYTNVKNSKPLPERHSSVTTKRDSVKLDIKTTNKETLSMKTKYHPYDYEINSHITPTDRIVEKYTEVISDFSDEKDTKPLEESDLLTNEQAPSLSVSHKVPNNKTNDKLKPDRPQKVNKNKLVVAELIKLGSLGIKGLSQLAPVFEKMTGSFMKRQEVSQNITTTTEKPVTKPTPYTADKRVDSEETKHGNFPIYIPVDEMETAESQSSYSNISLHKNYPWAFDLKHSKGHYIVPPKIVQESPLVNGGIPISPGQIIRANSDVIVGKPAVGSPLTLAASGVKYHNPVKRPLEDSFMADSEQYPVNDQYPLTLPQNKKKEATKVDDSFDLRPPEPPKVYSKKNGLRPPSLPPYVHHSSNVALIDSKDRKTQANKIKSGDGLRDHGRPAFLDYIPSLAKPTSTNIPLEHHIEFRPVNDNKDGYDIMDSSPSSSEIVSSKIEATDEDISDSSDSMNKPYLVDIQPSRVANVLIPHGSSTALVFAGSSEPHKTGDYIDDPLPYPEPGYFGSFSIDAPQMTNVHSVPPNKGQFLKKPSVLSSTGILQSDNIKTTFNKEKEIQTNNIIKPKWESNQFTNKQNIPPPVSVQESHVRIGPQITVYKPENYNGDFEKYKQNKKPLKSKDGKDIIDLEYENYLSVPPPPPKSLYQDIHYPKNKPYNQRPIVHTKPVQDMKVFLNVQHPVPDQLPPKITSEIYFASQPPKSVQTTYFNIPKLPPTHDLHYNKHQDDKYPHKPNFESNSFSIISSPNISNDSIITNINRDDDNTYSITINTATGVKNGPSSPHKIGSSISVPLSTSEQNGEINANIPIGTNFAIRVEDDPTKYDTVALHGKRDPSLIYDKASQDNYNIVTSKINSQESNVTQKHDSENDNKDVMVTAYPSLNSHANFPMINEKDQVSNKNIKPVTEIVDDMESHEQRRPGKIISHIPTNSHGWYSSILNEDNYKNINNIKVEATTRKVIPLSYEYKERLPDFGPKITTAGKPPSDFLDSNPKPSVNNFNIGRPFSKQKDADKPTVSTFTIKPSYIPSIYSSKQPVYNIPIIDNSEDFTTKKPVSKGNIKPVYETPEEIYDGKEESEETNEDMSGEISSESMKIHVVTSSNENKNITKSSNEVIPTVSIAKPEFVKFNPGTQTEKPFRSNNETRFVSNNMKPIFNQNPYSKPRPFTINIPAALDHQLQQPHWQINQMMENGTNASYEDSLESVSEEKEHKLVLHNTTKFSNGSTVQINDRNKGSHHKISGVKNDSNIITSTINIQDKKRLVIKVPDRSTLPTFTIKSDEETNHTSEIMDLSPPPQRTNYNSKPWQNNELIMGMSPPPLGTNKHPMRVPQTSRPPARTPPPYRNVPPRTLPPRPNAQRPVKKPTAINEEVSTYRPASNVLNKLKRPYFNRDQPSSVLLPPPRELPTTVSEVESIPATPVAAPPISSVIFPTPTSSGWMTSSGIDFSSKFKFSPTSVQYPEIITSSRIEADLVDTSAENSYSYEDISNSQDDSLEKQHDTKNDSKLQQTADTSNVFRNITNFDKSSSYETSQEDETQDQMKVIPIGMRNRTRKPYPIRSDVRSSYKYSPSKSSNIISPTKTLSRPEVLYPTRQVSIKNIVRPGISRYPNRPIRPVDIIESSETVVEDDVIKPTQTLSMYDDMLTDSFEKTSVIEKTVTSTLTINKEPEIVNTQVLHHAGNEIKISDEIVPTKTEFKTTVVTLTKTLSEPPTTVSSVGYVNLTHTLTVTHTKTSLVSQSEGAITQTLVLTNTHTSTVVDVITEIYTQVQPTTIIETVTKHIPIPQVEATPVLEITTTKIPLDDISMSSEEKENFIIKDSDVTENIQKIEQEEENDNDSFFVVMNKSQNGGKSPPISTDIETGDYEITRNEQVNSNGVSQVLFGEILLAGTPYLETTNIGHSGIAFGKECQPDCKASRNERCQRIDGLMKCVCRPGFARMFPDRPCKPTYTYSVSLVLASQGNTRLKFHPQLADNSSKEYNNLAIATHEGINRMVMQSDLRDVFHGVHITGFHPVPMKAKNGEIYQGVANDFYVQLSDNAHEYRLKEVIEKYLRNNNYSLGGTEVHAASDLIDRLNVSDFDECLSSQFHDCSEHAKCFNLRGTYTCSCLEGFADLSVNSLYPGRICSSESVGCDTCNYHGTCFDRESAVICECFKWYAGKTCQINLKAALITVTASGLLIIAAVTIYASRRCCAARPPAQTFVIGCMQGMPGLHQGNVPKQRADRRALIAEREAAETCSVQNASLPYVPSKRSQRPSKHIVMSAPPSHCPPPPPAPAVLIPRARLHHSDSRENISRKKSLEACTEAKLISYLESGATNVTEEMRRKHSLESSYSANKDRHNKQGALVSAGFKVSTTVRPEEGVKDDDASSINKTDIDGTMSRFDTLRKSYSQDDNMSEWTDAERRLGELTLSEARSVGGTLPASSARLTHQENTMAERDLGSTFLLPHVHLYKPDPTSDVSEFDSL